MRKSRRNCIGWSLPRRGWPRSRKPGQFVIVRAGRAGSASRSPSPTTTRRRHDHPDHPGGRHQHPGDRGGARRRLHPRRGRARWASPPRSSSWAGWSAWAAASARRCCSRWPAPGRGGQRADHHHRRAQREVRDPAGRAGRVLQARATSPPRTARCGEKGFVTLPLKRILADPDQRPAAVYAVGPVPMMTAVCDLTRSYGVRTIVSPQPHHGGRHGHVRRLPGDRGRPDRSSPAWTARNSTGTRWISANCRPGRPPTLSWTPTAAGWTRKSPN